MCCTRIVMYLLLQLLEACVSNCGKEFQLELTKPTFHSDARAILMGVSDSDIQCTGYMCVGDQVVDLEVPGSSQPLCDRDFLLLQGWDIKLIGPGGPGSFLHQALVKHLSLVPSPYPTFRCLQYR